MLLVTKVMLQHETSKGHNNFYDYLNIQTG